MKYIRVLEKYSSPGSYPELLSFDSGSLSKDFEFLYNIENKDPHYAIQEIQKLRCSSRWESLPLRTRSRISRRLRPLRVKRARLRGTHTQEEWELLVFLCNDCCLRCRIHKSNLYGNSLCKDHVIPLEHESSSDKISNIQPLCRECNSSKNMNVELVDYVDPVIRTYFDNRNRRSL